MPKWSRIFFFSFDCTGKLLYSCLFVRATFHRVLHSQEMQAGERRSTRKGRATAPRRMYTDTATKKKRLRGVNLFSGDVDIYGLTPLRGPPFFFSVWICLHDAPLPAHASAVLRSSRPTVFKDFAFRHAGVERQSARTSGGGNKKRSDFFFLPMLRKYNGVVVSGEERCTAVNKTDLDTLSLLCRMVGWYVEEYICRLTITSSLPSPVA